MLRWMQYRAFVLVLQLEAARRDMEAKVVALTQRVRREALPYMGATTVSRLIV